MAPTYSQLSTRLGFPVPRSYARFIELAVEEAAAENWNPFELLPFMYLKNAGPKAISISKPGDSVIFGWTGCDSEHFIFVMDDNAADDRERPIAFWPIDGREETGLIANSFPEFLEWLCATSMDDAESHDRMRLLAMLENEWDISKIRKENAIVKNARARRLKDPTVVPTLDNIGIVLPEGAVDQKHLKSIRWPRADDYSAEPQQKLLDESERRLKVGEVGTALLLARNYRFKWWYSDWKSGATAIRRTSAVMAQAYRQLGRPMAASEIERQTEWNLANVL